MKKRPLEVFPLNPTEIAHRVVDIASDLQAEDIVLLDIRGQAIFADYFVIMTAGTDRQARALRDDMVRRLKLAGVALNSREGGTGRLRLGAPRLRRRYRPYLRRGAAGVLPAGGTLEQGPPGGQDSVVFPQLFLPSRSSSVGRFGSQGGYVPRISGFLPAVLGLQGIYAPYIWILDILSFVRKGCYNQGEVRGCRTTKSRDGSRVYREIL